MLLTQFSMASKSFRGNIIQALDVLASHDCINWQVRQNWPPQRSNQAWHWTNSTVHKQGTLESCNKWYKIQLVGSSRWPLSRFLAIFKESIIGELTKRCKLDGEQWRTTPIISPKCWTDAWNQSRSKSYKWLETQLCGESIFYINSSRTSKDEINVAFVKKYRLDNWKWTKLDEYFHHQTSCWLIKYNKDDYIKSSCNCKGYKKDFICKHILFIAIRIDASIVPSRIKNIPLCASAKPGRPKKNTAAWINDEAPSSKKKKIFLLFINTFLLS